MNDRLHPAKASRSAAVKARLDHPVIDTDVHVNDYAPVLEDYIQHYGGSKLADALRKALGSRYPRGATARTGTSRRRQSAMTTARCARRGGRGSRATRWTWPPTPCPSCCTSAWPNRAPTIPSCSRTTCWRRWARATRRASRCTAPSTTSTPTSTASTPTASPRGRHPLNTPQEGIEELEFAVKTLGLKVINIAGGVKRPIKAIARKYPADQYPEIARHASYVDFYGIDSEYDYDPFWAKVVELGVPVTTHYGSQGWTGRQSTSNYMFNHIGHFADGSQAFAKALFFGGVTRRFPNLRVALLEGGADWGSHVYTHLVDRWEKRNRKAVQNYNPAHADLALLQDLFSRYGADFIRGRELDPAQLLRDSLGISALPHSREPHEDELDDFAAAGIESAEDIRKRWVDSFYFGSEADDRTVAAAFNDRVHPLGAKINAIWSSDIGHWDVPDLTEPLAESWDLVEQGVISEQDFKALVFGNPYRLYTEANPDFFRGTEIERKLAARPAATDTKTRAA